MKLLFEQYLSHKLAARLDCGFPGPAHVRDVRLAKATDAVVGSYAAAHGLVIASEHMDFQPRALLLGQPAKVVWIRLSNCLTRGVARLPRSEVAVLRQFEANPSAAFIALA